MASKVAAQSAAVSTNGNTVAQGVGPLKLVNLLVNVTAVSGTTPSMALTVEWSNDGSVWYKSDPPDAFTAITAVGTAVKQFVAKAHQFRVVWALTGTTPSFTFAVETCHYPLNKSASL